MTEIEILGKYIQWVNGDESLEKKYKIYYIIWVEKFLMKNEELLRGNAIKFEHVAEFLGSMVGQKNIKSWQVIQAADALCILFKMLEDTDK